MTFIYVSNCIAVALHDGALFKYNTMLGSVAVTPPRRFLPFSASVKENVESRWPTFLFISMTTIRTISLTFHCPLSILYLVS